MWIQFDIAPRDALAAPTTSSETAIQSTAILVVSILSVIGAGWIILSFVVRVRKRLDPKTIADIALSASRLYGRSGISLFCKYVGT
jgi:hypothetical protein